MGKAAMRPALSPGARESQLISLAVDLAEKQLREGTASSQIITHYLNLGTDKYKHECERLEAENKMLIAKTEALEQDKKDRVQYEELLKALRNYSGNGDPDEYED